MSLVDDISESRQKQIVSQVRWNFLTVGFLLLFLGIPIMFWEIARKVCELLIFCFMIPRKLAHAHCNSQSLSSLGIVQLLKSQAVLVCREFRSVVSNPLVFVWYLPARAEALIKAVQDGVAEIPPPEDAPDPGPGSEVASVPDGSPRSPPSSWDDPSFGLETRPELRVELLRIAEEAEEAE
jgi:hypothetical protein